MDLSISERVSILIAMYFLCSKISDFAPSFFGLEKEIRLKEQDIEAVRERVKEWEDTDSENDYT
jgi:hypothetical protein